MNKIHFAPDTSEEVRAAIEPHLLKWSFLIPAWCSEVNVTWRDDDLDGALSVIVHYEYRRADISVLPNFLSSPHRRERNVVHELLHIVLGPMLNTERDLRNALGKDRPDVHSWAEEMIRHSNDDTPVARGRVALWLLISSHRTHGGASSVS
jgi:hypothetical protein